MKRLLCLASLFISAVSPACAAEVPVRVIVDTQHPAHAVSPLLHGIFFEDINYAADGGLYAELVQNRSFEHAEALFAWGTVNRGGAGEVTIETAAPLNGKNPHYARLAVHEAGKGFGLANSGFGGIAISAGENYLVSLRARSTATGTAPAITALTAILEDETGRPLGTCGLAGVEGAWKKFEGTIRASGPTTRGRAGHAVNFLRSDRFPPAAPARPWKRRGGWGG